MARKAASAGRGMGAGRRKTPAGSSMPAKRKAPVAPPEAKRKATPKPASTRSGNAKLRPLKDLSPAYRKRLQAAAKKRGVTVKELRKTPGLARGHKPREHVTRAERFLQRVADFAARQSYRGEAQGARSADDIEESLLELIEEKGRAWFQQLEKRIDQMHAAYRKARYEPIGMDMDTLALEYELPQTELFYH